GGAVRVRGRAVHAGDLAAAPGRDRHRCLTGPGRPRGARGRYGFVPTRSGGAPAAGNPRTATTSGGGPPSTGRPPSVVPAGAVLPAGRGRGTGTGGPGHPDADAALGGPGHVPAGGRRRGGGGGGGAGGARGPHGRARRGRLRVGPVGSATHGGGAAHRPTRLRQTGPPWRAWPGCCGTWTARGWTANACGTGR